MANVKKSSKIKVVKPIEAKVTVDKDDQIKPGPLEGRKKVRAK